nr:skin secretory protein xP2-like [Aegilops tauschii subsp. strangulata]
MARAAKAKKGKVKAEDESSSHGGSEVQATEEAAGDELAGDNLAGLEALATAAMILQEEEEEIGEVAEPEEEWLMAGSQAPKPVLDRPPRRAANRGAAAPNPVPVAKRVKKTTTKATKAEVACRQSPRLAQTKASPAEQSADVEVDSSSHSGSSSSQSSSSPEPPATRRTPKPLGSYVPPPPKRGREPSPPMEFNLNSMLIQKEEVEEDTEALIYRPQKKLRCARSLRGAKSSALVGSDAEGLVPSPWPGSDGDGLPVPSTGVGGQTTQGKLLPEGHASPVNQAERIPTKPSADEVPQKAVVTITAKGEAHGPATDTTEETEISARQTPPAPKAEEPELLEVVADIGRAAADEAVEIAAAEGQDLAAGNAQGSLAVVEHSSENLPKEEAAVEGKLPLQTMDPLPSSGIIMEIPPPLSSTLAMVLSPPGTGAPDPFLMMGAELDEELQRLLSPLYQGAREAEDSAAVAMDLSFLESMATGVKEMQARHN